jgi:hypothetical protein
MRSILGPRAAAAVLLAVGSLAGLAACGDDDPAGVAGQDTPSATPTSPPAPTTGGPTSADPSSGGPAGPIPDDFPLLDGYPADSRSEGGDHGRQGPDRTSDPIEPEACGRSLPVPAHVDLLRGGWTNPEDYRQRQLVTFGSEAEAQAYADAVLEIYRSCPREDTDDGYTTVIEVVPGNLGDASAVAVTRYELDGAPAVGLGSMQVVRVGTVILLATTYNEGGAGPDPELTVRDEARRSAREVAGAMAELA